ncbi:MAG: hypothetical protein ACRCUQ_00800 [Alphaproteobacteria bacterium]
MVDSTQAFGAFTILFLVFSIPLPGKIGFFNEISPFQRSASVRGGGGAVVPLSNGSSRRRTKVESSSFPFLFSEKPSEPSTFSQSEPQRLDMQHQEDGEEPVRTSGETISRRLLQDLHDVQPIETVGTTFSGTREELNIENTEQPGDISAGTFAAGMLETSLQTFIETENEASQTSQDPFIVVTSPSSADSVVGQGLSALPNTEELFISNFDEEDGGYKSRRKLCIEHLTNVMHFDGAGDLLVPLRDEADESQSTSPSYNFSASCENLFFGENYLLKKPNVQEERSLDETSLSSNSLKKNSSTLRSSRRRSLSDSQLFEGYR